MKLIPVLKLSIFALLTCSALTPSFAGTGDIQEPSVQLIVPIESGGSGLQTADGGQVTTHVDLNKFWPVNTFPSADKALVYNSVRLIIVNDALNNADSAKLVEKLTQIYSIDISKSNIQAPLNDAFDESRNQYDAFKLTKMDQIFSDQKDNEYIIAIVPDDIYVFSTNFVFGATIYNKLRTVLSSAHLKTDATAHPIFQGNAENIPVNRFYKII